MLIKKWRITRKASLWSFNAAWRAAQGQCAPSPQAFRLASAPGRAAGSPCRDVLMQAQAA